MSELRRGITTPEAFAEALKEKGAPVAYHATADTMREAFEQIAGEEITFNATDETVSEKVVNKEVEEVEETTPDVEEPQQTTSRRSTKKTKVVEETKTEEDNKDEEPKTSEEDETAEESDDVVEDETTEGSDESEEDEETSLLGKLFGKNK